MYSTAGYFNACCNLTFRMALVNTTALGLVVVFCFCCLRIVVLYDFIHRSGWHWIFILGHWSLNFSWRLCCIIVLDIHDVEFDFRKLWWTENQKHIRLCGFAKPKHFYYEVWIFFGVCIMKVKCIVKLTVIISTEVEFVSEKFLSFPVCVSSYQM